MVFQLSYQNRWNANIEQCQIARSEQVLHHEVIYYWPNIAEDKHMDISRSLVTIDVPTSRGLFTKQTWNENLESIQLLYF